MNTVIWKSLLLIAILVVVFVFFLWYANFRMKDISQQHKALCEKTAREEAAKETKAGENGIAAPSQASYDAAYKKCMEQSLFLSPQ